MKKLSLIQTIQLIAVVMFMLQLIYGVINTIRVNTMGHHIESIELQYMPITEHITLITEYQLEQEIEFERAFRYALEMKDNSGAVAHFKHAVAAFELLSSKLNNEISSTEKRILHAIELVEEEEKLTSLEHELENIDKQHVKWVEHVNEVLALLAKNQFSLASEKAQVVEEEAVVLEKKVITLLSSIEHLTIEMLHKLKQEEESIFNIG